MTSAHRLAILRERVRARIANNGRTRVVHPCEQTRTASHYRIEAYAVVLFEIESLLSEEV